LRFGCVVVVVLVVLVLLLLLAAACCWVAHDDLFANQSFVCRSGFVHDPLVQTCIFDDTWPGQGGDRRRLLHSADSQADSDSSKGSGARDSVDECPAVTSEDLQQLKAAHAEEIAALAAKMDAMMAIMLDVQRGQDNSKA
jgi:hypothetical protein